MTPDDRVLLADALNALCENVTWIEDGALRNLDNNVHLAEALGELEPPVAIAHSTIAKYRQSQLDNCRIDVIWGLTTLANQRLALPVMTEHEELSQVALTPNYFFLHRDFARSNELLELRRDRLRKIFNGG